VTPYFQTIQARLVALWDVFERWIKVINMENMMPVDSFKFLPRLIEMFYKMTEIETSDGIPWTPLEKPIEESLFALVTSAGLYNQAEDDPFDIEREKREPSWGDPTARKIHHSIPPDDLGISHLHLNTDPIFEDPNIVLPLDRFKELQDQGEIGGLASTHFSLMGFQGFPPDTSTWRGETGNQIADSFHSEGVDCVLLTPA
jgi:D-proline reductase (dithiol) PrdB